MIHTIPTTRKSLLDALKIASFGLIEIKCHNDDLPPTQSITAHKQDSIPSVGIFITAIYTTTYTRLLCVYDDNNTHTTHAYNNNTHILYIIPYFCKHIIIKLIYIK